MTKKSREGINIICIANKASTSTWMDTL